MILLGLAVTFMILRCFWSVIKDCCKSSPSPATPTIAPSKKKWVLSWIPVWVEDDD